MLNGIWWNCDEDDNSWDTTVTFLYGINTEYSKMQTALRSNDPFIQGSEVLRWEQDFVTKHKVGTIIATQEQIHQELLQEFGGGYESDGDEYF